MSMRAARSQAGAAKSCDNSRLPDGFMSLRQLAEFAGLSVRTLRKHLTNASRPLPHYLVGGKIIVSAAEFNAWIAAFRVAEPVRLDGVVAELLKDL